MKALIVEDSRLARAELKRMLTAHSEIILCGEAANPRDALPIIKQERPNLLFLDIHMPGKTGLELLHELDYAPMVIFITAHADYALRSFEFTTIDYLLKPISEARLNAAIEKIGRLTTADEFKVDPLGLNSQLLLRDTDSCFWVGLNDIDYFESCANHTRVVWSRGQALINKSLSKIEERLPSESFFRASRQHIVNISAINTVEPWFNGGFQLRLKSATEIEVSRRHALRFKEIFSL